MNKDILVGKSTIHLELLPGSNMSLHTEVISNLVYLQELGAKEGFDIRVASGFRSYERQLLIFNQKASGERPLLDEKGFHLDPKALSKEELLFAILRWSALPGASRHHWGTDFDIYDHAALPSPDYQIKLTNDECEDEGPFAPLHEWLDELFHSDQNLEFFRPYEKDRGGIAPERWHLSYAPIAQEYSNQYTIDLLRQTIEEADILLKDEILKNLPDIYQRFVVI